MNTSDARNTSGQGVTRLPVVSSNIISVGYDAESGLLEVEFKGGAVYRYNGVPESEYARLLAAPSIGAHLHQHIKNCYLCERLK